MIDLANELNYRRCQVEIVGASIRCVSKTEDLSCTHMPLINFRDSSVTLDELCLHSSIDTLDWRATGYQTTHSWVGSGITSFGVVTYHRQQ